MDGDHRLEALHVQRGDKIGAVQQVDVQPAQRRAQLELGRQQALLPAVVAGRPDALPLHVRLIDQQPAILAALQQQVVVGAIQPRQRLRQVNGILADPCAGVVGNAGVNRDSHRRATTMRGERNQQKTSIPCNCLAWRRRCLNRTQLYHTQTADASLHAPGRVPASACLRALTRAIIGALAQRTREIAALGIIPAKLGVLSAAATSEVHYPKVTSRKQRMSLLEQLDNDLKAALLARDEDRKRTVRSVKTAATNAMIEKRTTEGLSASLSDEEVLKVIAKQANQRRDSIAEFSKAGRMDLVAQEQAELAILQEYLPKQLGAGRGLGHCPAGDRRDRRQQRQGYGPGDARGYGTAARSGRRQAGQPARARAAGLACASATRREHNDDLRLRAPSSLRTGQAAPLHASSAACWRLARCSSQAPRWRWWCAGRPWASLRCGWATVSPTDIHAPQLHRVHQRSADRRGELAG